MEPIIYGPFESEPFALYKYISYALSKLVEIPMVINSKETIERTIISSLPIEEIKVDFIVGEEENNE